MKIKNKLIATILALGLALSGLPLSVEALPSIPKLIDLPDKETINALSKQATPEQNFTLRSRASFPASYDLRIDHAATPVKNQNPLGTCYAFATIGAIESNLLMKMDLASRSNSFNTLNLSEKQLAFFTKHTQPQGSHQAGEGAVYTNLEADKILDGAYMTETMGQLSNGEGVKNASQVPYKEPWTLEEIDRFGDMARLNSAEILPSLVTKTENNSSPSYIRNQSGIDATKTALLNKGALNLFMGVATTPPVSDYWKAENGAYYHKDPTINHFVTLIGWNDNFPKENFSANNQPPNNGAWLCKNSWGTDDDENGNYLTQIPSTTNTTGLILVIFGYPMMMLR